MSFLREQEHLPATAGFELGRAILCGGDESGYAVDALARLGDAAIPIVAKLVEDRSLDTQMRASYVLTRLRNPTEQTFLRSIRPILDRHPASERFPGILALSAFPLNPASAASLTREQLNDSSYTSKLGGAVLVARRAADPDLFREMQTSSYATIRYAGASYAEELRRQRMATHKVVEPPLPPEEVTRRAEIEKQLQALALAALPECLKFLSTAHDPHEKLCLLHCLRFIYPRVESERVSIAQSLRALRVVRGSLLDTEIQQWLIDYLERSK
ncbi:MAG TPA: hypothetical protein VF614_13125 [Chthoniobacteraceae bacterium]